MTGLLLSNGPWLVAAFAILVTFGVYRLMQIGRRDPRLPPGPPTLPIIGNLHQIPISGLHKKSKEWSDKYGPVYSLKIGSGTVIVLNDRKAVHDMLDKRSAIYSGRPENYIARLVTHSENFVHMDNTPTWRAQRKVASHNLSPRVLDDKVAPLLEADNDYPNMEPWMMRFRFLESIHNYFHKTSILLHDILRTPALFHTHIKRATASLANTIIWGHRGDSPASFWGSNTYAALAETATSLQPGANPPVDQFPFLKHLPDSLAPWKRRARRSYDVIHATWTEARRHADERRAAGVKRPSLFDRIADGEARFDVPMTEVQINHFLGTLVEGGAGTTANAMLNSLVQIAVHPEVRRRARRELDEVCGAGRMPGWADSKGLPYVNCIVKEGMRWKPVAPLGIPHCVKRDDWYDGMFVPKGATIVMPIWAMHMAEENGYKNPGVYDPGRWEKHTRLSSELVGVADYKNRDNYGAGRRVCPGMHLAERSMWLMTAKLLWAFDITTDRYIDPEYNGEGTRVGPKLYKVEFRPRSDAHARTVLREAESAQGVLSMYN